MNAKSVSRDYIDGPTLLVVADDPNVLVLAQAILSGGRNRVLIANSAQSAVQLLKLTHIHIHSLAIRADMTGWEDVRYWSLRRGLAPWFFCASVQDGVIQLKGLHCEAVASDPGDLATNGKVAAAGLSHVQ